MDMRVIPLALGAFAIGTDSFVVAGILPEIAQSLNVSIEAAGQLITAYAVSYAIMTPVMAALTSHWSRRLVLGCGLAIFTAGNVMTAVLADFGLILASRVIAGLGGAIYMPAASAVAVMLVPPEARGRALAIVMAGLSGATALGAPLGTLVGNVGSWRATMWVVATLGVLATLAIATLLPAVAATARLTLRERLSPLRNARVLLTLATTLLVLTGLYTVYSYISIVFARATAGRGEVLAMLIAVWGAAAVVGNIAAGALTDRFGSRLVLNVAIVIVGIDFAFLSLSSAALSASILALLVWGACGWGMLVPQQHRLVSIAPAMAPILLSLNAATIYVAVAISGVFGAVMLQLFEPHELGMAGAVLIFSGLAASEWAHRLIRPLKATQRMDAVGQKTMARDTTCDELR